MPLSRITSVLFVGFFDVLEPLAGIAAEHGAAIRLAFGPRQRAAWDAVAANSATTKDLVEGAVVAEDFDSVADELGLDDSWLVLSMGAPFIFKQRHIDRVGGNIVNSHGAPLPQHAGGGGMSWRIMSGDRRGTVLLHQVTEGIDEGDVLRRTDFEFPADLRHPRDFEEFVAPLTRTAAIELLIDILTTGALPEGVPQSGRSTYFPRLSTPVHGAIDWRWDHHDIESFVLAFAAPHTGAFTTCRGAHVNVVDANAVAWTATLPHPFMSGLIVASDGDGWIVAAPGGHLRVVVQSAGPSPRLGDRMFTPVEMLERAWSTRVEFLPGGMREQSARP